jgi:glutaredoxin 3
VAIANQSRTNRPIERPRDAAEVTVYTLPFCGHCVRAKALLERRGIAYREVSGAGDRDFRQRLATLTGGYTVPQIVIDGEPIGGANQLARLDRLDVLVPRVRRDPFPLTRQRRTLSARLVARWIGHRLTRRPHHSPWSTETVFIGPDGQRASEPS